MFDNIWVGLFGFLVLICGVDIVVMLLIKYVGGYFDVMMGSVVVGLEFYNWLWCMV